jgi:transcriptional regulator with XRE-family HTH domain
MLNENALKAEIVRNGLTQKELAKYLKMSESTFIRKMKNNTFGTDEAQMMIDRLNIADPVQIFFAKEVTCKATS